ncbi:MAG: prepilin peptidase [Gemmataceae bacterium]|nr:prepilin peptidase [Gemmataceae bacterium]MDW8243463.1 prepilin peptidase [Thermogemmata sp.]
MEKTFFPNEWFAWVFLGVLFGLTGIAAWTDTRRARIPNLLTVSMLLIGMILNAVRGGWLGAEGRPLWLWQTGSVWLGILDGLTLSLIGAVLAFALMFVLWIMGTCGGGDVKLMTAIGGWLGLGGFLFVWLATALVLLVWVFFRVLSSGLSPQRIKTTMARLDADRKAYNQGREIQPNRKLRMTYSLPLLISLVAVLLYVYRFELRIAAPRTASSVSVHSTEWIAHVDMPWKGA